MVNKMFNDGLLPHLDDFVVTKNSEKNSSESRLSSKDKAIQTTAPVFDDYDYGDKNYQQFETNKGKDKKKVLFLNLPPAINNSMLVRQRASAKDSLAAASLSTAVSLPLMIGGRSKCVVNLLDNRKVESEQDNSRNQGADSLVGSDSKATSSTFPASVSSSTNISTSSQQAVSNVPKNTALRAEQRRQNMVSVVRPVMNTTSSHPVNSLSASSTCSSSSSSSVSFYPSSVKQAVDQSKSGWQDNPGSERASIIEDFIQLEQKVRSKANITSHQDRTTNHNFTGTQSFYKSDLDELFLLENLSLNPNKNMQHEQLNEHQIKQQIILMKREGQELNRGIKRQHRFFLVKIEERKRNLQIIQSVWYQKDLKHAIEKLVDLYNEGLIFTCQESTDRLKSSCYSQKQKEYATLNSLNTSLVVDVMSILILRPKLWNLEICQLILPILTNDLLLQYDHTNNEANKYEYYTEIALKSLKLILTHFSPVIKTTLESLKENRKLIGKVDLSREDRVSKSLNCYKFLLEAQGIIMKRQASIKNNDNKLANLYRDLAQSFVIFQASFQDVQELSQRSRKNENKS